MKKIFSVFFALICIVSALTGILGIGAVSAAQAGGLAVKSRSAYLMDYNSGTLIYANNENEELPIASMNKVMTLLLCFEALDERAFSLDDSITVSAEASGMGGSQVFLEANHSYQIGNLIKSIVVASANDACVAMAEHIAGSEELFVERMNERAKELGMTHTVFINCTGLPGAGQHSTAKDVAKMFSELLTHKDYYRYSGIWMDKIEHAEGRYTEISNTNKLIRFYDGCDGGKTGYTSEAGHCLVASAKRGNMRLVSVVIKAPDSKVRFGDVTQMFNYGFANYMNKTIVDENTPLEIPVRVDGGKKDEIQVIPEKIYYLFSEKNKKDALEIDFCPLEKVKAPIEKGELVGYLKIYRDQIEIGEVAVLANESVARSTYFDTIKDIAKDWAI